MDHRTSKQVRPAAHLLQQRLLQLLLDEPRAALLLPGQARNEGGKHARAVPPRHRLPMRRQARAHVVGLAHVEAVLLLGAFELQAGLASHNNQSLCAPRARSAPPCTSHLT